jgi:hypothetical protein
LANSISPVISSRCIEQDSSEQAGAFVAARKPGSVAFISKAAGASPTATSVLGGAGADSLPSSGAWQAAKTEMGNASKRTWNSRGPFVMFLNDRDPLAMHPPRFVFYKIASAQVIRIIQSFFSVI